MQGCIGSILGIPAQEIATSAGIYVAFAYGNNAKVDHRRLDCNGLLPNALLPNSILLTYISR